MNACVAFSMEIGDELGDLDEAVLNLSQLLLEYFAHRFLVLPVRERAQMPEPFGPGLMMSRTG